MSVSPHPVAPEAPPERKVSWRRAAVRIGLSAAVLALLFAFIPFAEVRAAIQRLPPAVWAAALVAYLCLHLIGVAKWRLLVNTAGAGLSFPQAIRAYYAGLFGNTFLPSIVGGDVVRAGVAFGVTRSRAGLLFGSLIDRILDFVALATVAGIGALLVPRALDAQSRRIFLVVAGLFVLMGLSAMGLIAVLRPRRFGFKVRRKMVRVRRAMRAVSRRPGAVAGAFLMGVTLQSLLVVLNAWLGARAGIEIPLYVWLFVWPLAKMSGIAPTQNGIGVREAAQVALFAPFGVPAGLALATGLVFEVIVISGGLVAGLIAFVIGRFAAVPAPEIPAPRPRAVSRRAAPRPN
jgi:glycosyltransferase 2 family protein